jgi:hypothetical protein
MNAMKGEPSVSMLISNVTVASNIPYGTVSTYQSASCGSEKVEIQSEGLTLSNQTVHISCGNKNTVLATGGSPALTVFN